jgi:CsoR family transcriptional regulator, copper-sensing transcriptional repressor
MYKPKNTKERVAHRYKISVGQLKKVVSMVEKGVYCVDILLQSQAIQKALKETDNVLLENHLKTCASKAIRSGRGNKAIAEIMDVFKKRVSK